MTKACLLPLAIALSAAPASAQAATPDGWRALTFDLARLGAVDRAVINWTVAARGVVGIVEDVAAVSAPDPDATGAPALRRELSVSGRFGLRVGGGGLVYGRVGYAELDRSDALAGSSPRQRSLVGVLVGAGSEVKLSPALSFRTELPAGRLCRRFGGPARADRPVLALLILRERHRLAPRFGRPHDA